MNAARFAIINTFTGRLWNGEHGYTLENCETIMDSMQRECPKMAQWYDVFELTADGWKEAEYC